MRGIIFCEEWQKVNEKKNPLGKESPDSRVRTRECQKLPAECLKYFFFSPLQSRLLIQISTVVETDI